MSENCSVVGNCIDVAAEPGVVAPHLFGHVALKTARYENMIQWYITVLNAQIVFKSEMVCFLTYDQEHHRIALLNLPDLEDKSPNSVGVDHLSFTYRSIDELIHTYKRLKAKSISPFWTILHGPTLSMYYKDPDAGSVELQIDCFESRQALEEWLPEAYKENPIGIKVDIEALFESYQAGVPLDRLLARRTLEPGESFLSHIVLGNK